MAPPKSGRHGVNTAHSESLSARSWFFIVIGVFIVCSTIDLERRMHKAPSQSAKAHSKTQSRDPPVEPSHEVVQTSNPPPKVVGDAAPLEESWSAENDDEETADKGRTHGAVRKGGLSKEARHSVHKDVSSAVKDMVAAEVAAQVAQEQAKQMMKDQEWMAETEKFETAQALKDSNAIKTRVEKAKEKGDRATEKRDRTLEKGERLGGDGENKKREKPVQRSEHLSEAAEKVTDRVTRMVKEEKVDDALAMQK
eukprot:gene10833-12817_t